MTRSTIAAALLAATALPAAAGTVTGYLYEVGPDVVLSFSGTVDTTGATIAFPDKSYDGYDLWPERGMWGAASSDYDIWLFPGLSGPANGFGPGFQEFNIGVGYGGDSFQIRSDMEFVALDGDYVSGDVLSGSATFAGETLLGLGANVGVYSYAFGGNTAILNVGVAPAPVPLPAGLALLLGGLGGLVAMRGRG